MRPGVWSLTFLYPRRINGESPRRPMVEEPLEPIVPGAWAAWARAQESDAAGTRDHASVPTGSLRRPAFHTTRS